MEGDAGTFFKGGFLFRVFFKVDFFPVLCLCAFPRLLTGYEAQFFLRVEAGQVSLVSSALSLGIIPVAH